MGRVALLFALLLAGCVSTTSRWVKIDESPINPQDELECWQRVSATIEPNSGSDAGSESYAMRVCMNERGYLLEVNRLRW